MAIRKKRVIATQAKQRGRDAMGRVDDQAQVIKAAVWGQLKPLDEKAREKQSKWGDRLPSLVAPDLAGRFEAAYEALGEAVDANDVKRTHDIATQLLRAWDVLEKAALDAGHHPLHEDAYCMEMDDGRIVCIALDGWASLRQKYPEWIVYSFSDAARVLCADFSARFLDEAFSAFPKAHVKSIIRNGEEHSRDINDEIPW